MRCEVLGRHCTQRASLWDAAQVKWGEHSMVEALRALLREALRDPLNQRFQLLCEYSLPLQSPLLVYQQYIKERKSRLNACNTFDWQEHVSTSSLGPCQGPVCSVALRLSCTSQVCGGHPKQDPHFEVPNPSKLALALREGWIGKVRGAAHTELSVTFKLSRTSV